MRVAIHAGQLLQPVPGGIGRYIRALFDHLAPAGAQPVAFAAGTRPVRLPPSVPWIDLGRPHGSVRYELWHRARRPVVRIPADLVHAPSLAVPPVAPASPLIVTAHDIAFARIPHITTRRGAYFHARGLELARRTATLILTPSEFTRGELVREGFESEFVVAVPFGVDSPAARTDDDIAETVAHVGVRRPYVLTVGTIEPRKDLPTLSNAVAKLRARHPSLTLVVVGPRGWGEVTHLDRAFVRVLGAQPWRVVDALYRRAAAFCVSSLYEGFGLPALEAMARGAPTIVTTGSSMEEFVRGAGVLFPARDVDACVDAIDRVLDDEAFRASLRDAARARAAQMSWDRSAQAHVRVYGRVLARTGS